MAAVTAVPAMHEEMNDWTEEQQDVRRGAEDVRAVLGQEQERRDDHEEAEA